MSTAMAQRDTDNMVIALTRRFQADLALSTGDICAAIEYLRDSDDALAQLEAGDV